MVDGMDKILPGTLSGEGEVREIPCNKIEPNPFQPRQTFAQEQLEELAQSIKTYGLLQPIIIRRQGFGYQLVVGERRLRACKMLGLQTILAVVKDIDDSAMAAIALIENLQRENLDYFEEAEGYNRLLDEFGFTQEVLAQRLGKSQSTIANKLRLLKLPAEIRKKLSAAGLSERHARALLKLPDDDTRSSLLAKIINMELNVRQTENLIESLLQDNRPVETGGTQKFIIKDFRVILNTIGQAVAAIEQTGLRPQMTHNETEEFFEVIIRLPKEGRH